MTIVYQDKVYNDKRQALCEFAFCRFPLDLTIDGEKMTFDWFSDLENYVNSH